MTRDEFITRLATLAAEGTITEEEAAELLRKYDAGEITAKDLPVPLSETLRQLSMQIATAQIMTGLGFLLLGQSVAELTQQRGRRLLAVLAQMQRNERYQLYARELDRFYGAAGDATRAYAAGDVRRWHRMMQQRLRTSMLTIAGLGSGGELSEAQLARVREEYRTQLAYLQRFADEVAAKRALGKPMSESQVTARARMYAGAARTFFYDQIEAELPPGYVVVWQARDDGGVCSPCLEADEGSPYLPGRGPKPGADTCLGAGLCRCSRGPVYAPAEYERLINQPVAEAA